MKNTTVATRIKQTLLTMLAMAWSSLLVLAANIPPRPEPARFVTDLAGILPPDSVAELESRLELLSKETSTQIVVIVVPDLEDLTITEYAQEIGDKWGIGQKGKDNGVILLVKPKTAQSKGEVDIAPGYGLEGALPDITCGHIIRDRIIPHFAANDYSGGISAGANTIILSVRGEYSAEASNDEVWPADNGEQGNDVTGLMALGVLGLGAAGVYSLAKNKYSAANKAYDKELSNAFVAFCNSARWAEREYDKVAGETGEKQSAAEAAYNRIVDKAKEEYAQAIYCAENNYQQALTTAKDTKKEEEKHHLKLMEKGQKRYAEYLQHMAARLAKIIGGAFALFMLLDAAIEQAERERARRNEQRMRSNRSYTSGSSSAPVRRGQSFGGGRFGGGGAHGSW